MEEAKKEQIERFMDKYCKSNTDRIKIYEDFNVDVASYEELLPGTTKKSYATGNKAISGAFIIFKVIDEEHEIIYYPVFSETVGRILVRKWDIRLPSKMTVFVGAGGGNRGNAGAGVQRDQRLDDNREMLQLIQFARSMMLLHVSNPGPMREPFLGIYKKLELNPSYHVWASDIKKVNSAILTFLDKPVNKEKENYRSLQHYITYLQNNYPDRHLRNFDFAILRNILIENYPNETIVF